MTIALKIGDEDSEVKGLIYLDAVVSYTKTLSGKVTSFPVDSGVKISDHFISENTKLSIEGVVTNVDITGRSGMIKLGELKPLNSNPQPPAMQVKGPDKSLKMLPAAVAEFFESSDPEVSAAPVPQNNTPVIEALLVELMSANYYNQVDNRWRNKMTFVTLYEISGIDFVNAQTNLVMTDVRITESLETGDSLQLSLNLEKVRLVTLDKVEMAQKAKPAYKKKVAPKQSQGKQSCPEGTSDSTKSDSNKDAPNQSKVNTKQPNSIDRALEAIGVWRGQR